MKRLEWLPHSVDRGFPLDNRRGLFERSYPFGLFFYGFVKNRHDGADAFRGSGALLEGLGSRLTGRDSEAIFLIVLPGFAVVAHSVFQMLGYFPGEDLSY